MSMAIGVLVSFSPLTGINCKVEADTTSNDFKDSKLNDVDLNDRFSFFNENTVYPQSALEIKPKINAVLSEKNEKITPIVEVLETRYTTLTGYSSTVDQTNGNPFVTASGYWVRDGIVAANFLPFGTKIRIPEIFGDKVFVVKDRMNRRYDNRVDVWFSTRQEAINFGLKSSYIEIVK